MGGTTNVVKEEEDAKRRKHLKLKKLKKLKKNL